MTTTYAIAAAMAAAAKDHDCPEWAAELERSAEDLRRSLADAATWAGSDDPDAAAIAEQVRETAAAEALGKLFGAVGYEQTRRLLADPSA